MGLYRRGLVSDPRFAVFEDGKLEAGDRFRQLAARRYQVNPFSKDDFTALVRQLVDDDRPLRVELDADFLESQLIAALAIARRLKASDSSIKTPAPEPGTNPPAEADSGRDAFSGSSLKLRHNTRIASKPAQM